MNLRTGNLRQHCRDALFPRRSVCRFFLWASGRQVWPAPRCNRSGGIRRRRRPQYSVGTRRHLIRSCKVISRSYISSKQWKLLIHRIYLNLIQSNKISRDRMLKRRCCSNCHKEYWIILHRKCRNAVNYFSTISQKPSGLSSACLSLE